MKKRFALIMLAAIALAGCQKKELDLPVAESLPFIGTTESFDTETKTTLEDGRVLWKRGDQVSIFAGRTLNERYQVTDDSDGQTTAGFTVVSSSPGFSSSVAIPNNVSYYPYSANNSLAQNANVYELSTTLPAVQQYAENSFGPGAFPMTSVTSSTSDYNLKFKNVLGGVKLQLKGDAKIASISITGNADEVLCGAAKVSVEAGGVPSIDLTDATATTVTLDCGAGVQLSSTEATSFIIALPPLTMTSGFTVTVKDTDGMTMEISTDKSQTISRSSILKMPAKEYVGTSSTGQPSRELCFTAEQAGSTVTLNKNGEPYDVPQEYCADGKHWYPYTFGTPITLANIGDKVSFRKMTDGVAEGFSKGYDSNERTDNYYQFAMSGRLVASGNVMSLVDRTCQSTTIPNDYCFYCLFLNCKSLTQAPELPATTLAEGCYELMFDGCTALTQAPELPAMTLANNCYEYMFSGCALTQAPELPATTLAERCYGHMFSGCTSLTQAPELPATTLADGCYQFMFSRCALTQAPELPATTLRSTCYYYMFDVCKSLTQAPELPATTLAGHCYRGMFRGCSALTQAPELPATKLADYCYEDMFLNCKSLTQAPELPATTLADGCYYGMFNGCTSLTQAPELPATTLADGCYQSMFSRCTSLTKAPELPATTLAQGCYEYMFQGCTSLAQAPELPATTLADYCYRDMFYNCTSLTQAPELSAITLADGCYELMFYKCSNLNYVKALFTTTPGSGYTDNWLYGVADTGTFVMSKDATWDVWGADGIPDGWIAEIDYEDESEDDVEQLFTITSTGNTTVYIGLMNSPDPITLEYKVGRGSWNRCSYTAGGIQLSDGESVKFRAGLSGNETFAKNSNDSNIFRVDGPGTISVSGNIMSLLDRTMKRDNLSEYAFSNLFFFCSRLVDASGLVLPATTLSEGCYQYLFRSCTGLTAAPVLPATTLANHCYDGMFDGCTGLTSATELPATILADYCYNGMFKGCTGLTSAPELPATILADYCYNGMFQGCTGLSSAPELPATNLASHCYADMFRKCTGLTAAPELPATTLTEGCYYRMFNGCTGLTAAPELPATTLEPDCYSFMFRECANLNYVKALFTTAPGGGYTSYWLNGVAYTGTFVKNKNATWDVRGYSGIPEGWSVELDGDIELDGDVIWNDDFSWLREMIAEYNAANPSNPIGNSVTGYAATDFKGASGANAPNAYTAEPFKSKFPAALAAAGYEDLNAEGKVIYPQDEYLKFGKTSVHTSLKIKALPLTETANLTVEFDWCRHVQGTAIIDPVTLTVVITGDGMFENGTKYSDPLETPQTYVEGVSAQMGFTHSSVKIKGAGANTQINIVYTDCLDKSTGAYNWKVSGAHRYHIDNLKITKE